MWNLKCSGKKEGKEKRKRQREGGRRKGRKERRRKEGKKEGDRRGEGGESKRERKSKAKEKGRKSKAKEKEEKEKEKEKGDRWPLSLCLYNLNLASKTPFVAEKAADFSYELHRIGPLLITICQKALFTPAAFCWIQSTGGTAGRSNCVCLLSE